MAHFRVSRHARPFERLYGLTPPLGNPAIAWAAVVLRGVSCSHTHGTCTAPVRRNRNRHTGRLRSCSRWRGASSVAVYDSLSWSLIFDFDFWRRGPGIVAKLYRPFTSANEPAQNPLHSFCEKFFNGKATSLPHRCKCSRRNHERCTLRN
jgi:hypothetical protein